MPAAGESHILLGDPELLRPTAKGKVPPNTGLTEIKKVKADLATAYQAAETRRLAALQDERFEAVALMRGVMLRTIATMRPGSVRIALCDPNMGADFRDFSPMGNIDGQGHGLYTVDGTLHRHLTRLVNFIASVDSELQGASSVRELAAANAMSRPFVLAVILGAGQRMTEETADLMRTVVNDGPAHGVTLLTHGLNLSSRVSPVHRIRHVVKGGRRDGRLASAAAGNIAFWPDPSAPQNLVGATVHTIVNTERARRNTQNLLPAGDAAATEEAPSAPSPAPAAANTEPAELPGVVYNRAVTRAVREAITVTNAVSTFRAQFPLLEPGVSGAFNHSYGAYLQYIDTVAADRAQLRGDLGHSRNVDILQRLQTCAAADLVSDSPGDPITKARRLRSAAENALLLEQNMAGLIQTVAITAVHGREHLPEEVREWASQGLQEDPPAYAFQLVADRATGNDRHVGDAGGHTPQALRATLTHIERTYGVQLHDGAYITNQPMLEALIECEVARLYGADQPQVPNEVLDLIVRRSHRRLEAVSRDDLPPFAHQFYDVVMARLEVIGRIDNFGEKASKLGHGALALGSALIKKATSGGDGGDETNGTKKAAGDPEGPTGGQPT
jgi:hypothetical protein